jgi:hypothetical protein
MSSGTEGGLVIAVDEKPHIEVLERTQGYLKLPNGRALGGQAHDYTRHGTSTLFAALDIARGEVIARHYQRRRRIEFLDFMNRILAAHYMTLLHGGNRGSNPLGDASIVNSLEQMIPEHLTNLSQTCRWTRMGLHGRRFIPRAC